MLSPGRPGAPMRSLPDSGAAPWPPRRFLLCRPDLFDTHFLFNPFMDYREKVNHRRARAQWKHLRDAIENAGGAVDEATPEITTSALAFTADGALCYAPGQALVLRNDGPRGEYEPPVFTRWLRERGYATESLPPHYRLDGGNLIRLPTGDVLAGLKPGSAGLAEHYLDRLLRMASGVRVHTIPLVDERHLHLDTAVGVLAPGRFAVYADGLSGRRVPDVGPLAEADEILDVSADDARAFACNLIRVGSTIITGMISASLARRIERIGLEVLRVDLSEFHKAGGGVKCLTLPLWPGA